MVFDRRDMILLRLLGRYRWLPFKSLDKYGFKDIEDEIRKLVKLGYIGASKSGEYLRLKPAGYDLLDEAGYSYQRGNKRGFKGSPTLCRRLQTADIMLTCLRAGIDTLSDGVISLREQPVFFPTFDIRPAMMNSASCTAFGHLGNKAYMIQYISATSPGMYRVNEFAVFHNLSSVFRANHSEPMALLIAGESYADVYKRLTIEAPSARHGVKGFTDFRELYKTLDIPVYLVGCGETGARQLAVMSRPDYRERIARYAFGKSWQEDCGVPGADGSVNGIPLVVAVDMDINKIESAVSAAKYQGFTEIKLAAFRAQIMEVLHPLYTKGKPDSIVKLLDVEGPVLNAAFGPSLLCDLDTSPAQSESGGFIHA